MSSYKELNDAFASYGYQLLSYKENCYWLAQLLLDGLREYIGCEGEQLQVVDRNDQLVHLHDALYRKDDETSYQLNVRLFFECTVTLTAPKGGDTQHRLKGWITICILISQKDNQFIVQIENNNQKFVIDKSVLSAADGQKDPDLSSFYPFIYNQIRDFYTNRFQQQLQGLRPVFGFHIQPN